jgi:hypothetical protein
MTIRRGTLLLATMALMTAGLLAQPLLGCFGGDGETAGTDDGDYEEAVPDAELLTLALSEEGEGGAGLALARRALDTDPSEIQAYAREIAAQVNAAVARTHAVLDELFAAVTPTTTTVAGAPCRLWEADGERNHWTLTVCREDRAARRYRFALTGRPLGADAAEDVRVVAGRGQIHARVEGLRRGAGRIGWDFDALRRLTGEGPTGRVGVGYRAVGRLRQLHVALDGFQPQGATVAHDALLRFGRVIGQGGRLRFGVAADLLAPAEDGAGFVRGTDGVEEYGRAALVWARAGKARLVATVCGGTVGEGACVTARECWTREQVSWADVAAGGELPPWNEAVCPADRDLPFPAEEPPADEELDPPADDGELPGPAVDEPAAEPELEEPAAE